MKNLNNPVLKAQMVKTAAILSGLAMATLWGCAVPGSQVADAGDSGEATKEYVHELQTSPELRIPDAPVPAGYAYKPEKSVILEYPGVLAGVLHYEGPDDVAELIAYYRREMPKYEWTLSSMLESDETLMVFDKAGRTCRVGLRSLPGLRSKSVATIYYAPKREG